VWPEELGKFKKFTSSGIEPAKKLKLNYDRQSVVCQSGFVSGTHLGPATNFSLTLKFSWDSCGFVIL
jgi:hypothetical protein